MEQFVEIIFLGIMVTFRNYRILNGILFVHCLIGLKGNDKTFKQGIEGFCLF